MHPQLLALPSRESLGLSGSIQRLVGEPRQYCMASRRSVVQPISLEERQDVSWIGPWKHSIGG